MVSGHGVRLHVRIGALVGARVASSEGSLAADRAPHLRARAALRWAALGAVPGLQPSNPLGRIGSGWRTIALTLTLTLIHVVCDLGITT